MAKSKFQDNIKEDLKETACVNENHLFQKRDQGQVIINVVLKHGVTKKGDIL
jgi:hypothetical protein